MISLLNLTSKNPELQNIISRYDELRTWQKPNFQLAIFYVAISALTITIFAIGAMGDMSFGNMLGFIIGTALYIILSAFIFFKKIWAIWAALIMYGMDKIALIAEGAGSVGGQLAFFYVALALSLRAFYVERARRNIKNTGHEFVVS